MIEDEWGPFTDPLRVAADLTSKQLSLGERPPIDLVRPAKLVSGPMVETDPVADCVDSDGWVNVGKLSLLLLEALRQALGDWPMAFGGVLGSYDGSVWAAESDWDQRVARVEFNGAGSSGVERLTPAVIHKRAERLSTMIRARGWHQCHLFPPRHLPSGDVVMLAQHGLVIRVVTSYSVERDVQHTVVDLAGA